MKCDLCAKTATIHLTDIIQGHKKEMHLCQECAEEQQLVSPQQQLSLSTILQTVIGQHVGALTDELARLTCPACGIKYMEFRAGGRLGCPHDYQVFRKPLLSLLKRIHRKTRHQGKTPLHSRRRAVLQAEILELRRQLRSAVDREAYEEAARLRDQLRQKESANEPG